MDYDELLNLWENGTENEIVAKELLKYRRSEVLIFGAMFEKKFGNHATDKLAVLIDNEEMK